jgi:hypothetical protein
MNHDSKTTQMSRRDFLGMLAAASASLPLTAIESLHKEAMKIPSGKRSIHVFSKHLQWLDYGALAETVAATGFDGVDLTVRPGGHVLPERVQDDLPRAVEAMSKSGLNVDMMTTVIDNARTLAMLTRNPLLKLPAPWELNIIAWRGSIMTMRLALLKI